jgi:hypothetical protein
MQRPTEAPSVFVSYSHDSADHKTWVLGLATRLVANGVDILLDQWDLRLGGDLPRFMESGLTESRRVLAICTAAYVTKANEGLGGVGYEKMILTAQLMQNVTSDRVLPIVRDNTLAPPLPTFLGARVYSDFRDSSQFETKYTELLRELHGQPVLPRPPLGPNPFMTQAPQIVEPIISTSAERYVNPALSGRATFDYSDNNGRFVIGSGDMAFETAWSTAGNGSIHAYDDPPSIRTIALVLDATEISQVADATSYDTSSRHRAPSVGEILVWQNTAGYYAATKIEEVVVRSGRDAPHRLTFSYRIQPNRTASFRDA